MSAYTIGEAARRSGFSASALRFYEEIGLVAPAGRSPTGYRLYDDATLVRLAFVEITELALVWDGQRCGPVQRRFHELVTAKIRDAETQVAELSAFARQLRSAARRLGEDPVDGPCGDECACFTSENDSVPVACTLAAGAVPARVDEWTRVLGSATRRTPIDGGSRIEFERSVDLGELGRLIGAEQECCGFFTFALTVSAGGVVLEVRGPDLAEEIIDDLFGAVVGRS